MQDILCFQRLTPALKGGACAACSVKRYLSLVYHYHCTYIDQLSIMLYFSIALICVTSNITSESNDK